MIIKRRPTNGESVVRMGNSAALGKNRRAFGQRFTRDLVQHQLFRQHQRCCIPQPRVARHELPWVMVQKKFINPEGVEAIGLAPPNSM